MFPALANCCAIDWFTEWPVEALFAANHVLAEVDFDPKTKAGVVDVCTVMQEKVCILLLDYHCFRQPSQI